LLIVHWLLLYIHVTTRGLYDTALKEISQKQVYNGENRGQMSQIAGKYESVIYRDSKSLNSHPIKKGDSPTNT